MTEEEKARLIESAEVLKKYCQEHKSKSNYKGCDCPFSEAYNCGYLCGLYAYPSGWEEKNE